jgi:hypothetical protein
MKKILLLSAVLLGAVTVSQAGVHFGINIPLPAPPSIVVAPPAPVYVEPPAEAYVEPPPVYAPAPVIVAPPVLDFDYGYRRPYYRCYPYPYRGERNYWRHEHREHDHERGFRGYHRR